MIIVPELLFSIKREVAMGKRGGLEFFDLQFYVSSMFRFVMFAKKNVLCQKGASNLNIPQVANDVEALLKRFALTQVYNFLLTRTIPYQSIKRCVSIVGHGERSKRTTRVALRCSWLAHRQRNALRERSGEILIR